MKTTNHNIKDLGVTLSELYDGKKQVNVHLSDKPYVFSLILRDRHGVSDCKLSSFGANLFLRTNKGIKCEQYISLGTLQTSIKRAIANRVETDGVISFSLSDEVYTF